MTLNRTYNPNFHQQNIELPNDFAMILMIFQDRLYNFRNTGKPDPTMDPLLAAKLRQKCPQNSDGRNVVNLDQNPTSSLTIDNSYHQQLLKRRGILQIDQELMFDQRTVATVTRIASNNTDFSFKFGHAMVMLGAIEVLTGTQGEIRKSCRVIN